MLAGLGVELYRINYEFSHRYAECEMPINQQSQAGTYIYVQS